MAEEFPPPPDGELEEGEFPEGEFPEGEEGAPDDAAAYEEEELLMAFTPNDKLQRVSEIDVMEQPESYRNNTKKEELMLEYVSNFRRQFEDIYPGRKPLLLCPLNECGMRKFVCTTLRPTQLPYQELYDYDKCAKFVADFLRTIAPEVAEESLDHLRATINAQKRRLRRCRSGGTVDEDELVKETLRDHPPEERGTRAEWARRTGWHRREDTRRRAV